MVDRDTKVGDLCKELGVTRQTLYRFVGPKSELRPDGTKLLERKRQQASPYYARWVGGCSLNI